MTALLFYDLTHALGIALALLYLLRMAPKYGLHRLRALLCAASVIAVLLLLMKSLFFLFTGVWGGQNTVRIVAFIPLLGVLFARWFRLPKEEFLDAASPLVCIAQGVGKIGCQVMGCCRSQLAVDWGIYNPYTREKLFPIQLTEAAVSLLIAGVLILWMLRKKMQTKGRLMPWMLILFGTTRFALEFLRDNEKLFWGLSEFSLWSAFAACLGIILLALNFKKKKPIA